jgi:hypothetical protein
MAMKVSLNFDIVFVAHSEIALTINQKIPRATHGKGQYTISKH